MGNIDMKEMLTTFNCGVGLNIVVSQEIMKLKGKLYENQNFI